MAKIQFTFAVSDIKGKYAGSVFKGSGSGSSVQAKAYGRKKQPARLYSAKSVLGVFSQQWKGLTEATRNDWRAAALGTTNADCFGAVRKLTGFQLYMKAYITRYWYTNQIDPDITPGYNPPRYSITQPSGAPTPTLGTVGYYEDLQAFLFDLHGEGHGDTAGILAHVSYPQLDHLGYRKNALAIWGATSWQQDFDYPMEIDRAYPFPDIVRPCVIYIQLTPFDLVHYSSYTPRIYKCAPQLYF